MDCPLSRKPNTSSQFAVYSSQLGKHRYSWVSPLLQIRFEWIEDSLLVCYPNGDRFKTFNEVASERDRFAAKLRELGIDPESL